MTPGTPRRRTFAFVFAFGLSACVGAATVGGCRRTPPPAPPAEPQLPDTPPPQLARQFERDLRRDVNDQVRVGHVVRVSPGDGVATVDGVDTGGLRRGDTLVYFDGLGRRVAFGTVLDAGGSSVLAGFEPEFVRNGRPVREGDLAAFNLNPRAETPANNRRR